MNTGAERNIILILKQLKSKRIKKKNEYNFTEAILLIVTSQWAIKSMLKEEKVNFGELRDVQVLLEGSAEGRHQYLCLIKGQQEVGGAGQDAPGAVDEVIPGGNRVRVGLQHGGGLDQLGAGVLHPVQEEGGAGGRTTGGAGGEWSGNDLRGAVVALQRREQHAGSDVMRQAKELLRVEPLLFFFPASFNFNFSS